MRHLRDFAHTPDDGFDRFWQAYPRHVGKKDAQKVWAKLHPGPVLLDQILAALRWQAHTPQWTKDGGAFIPYPATWLRAERWEDEPFDTKPMLGKANSRIAAALDQIRRGES